MQKAPFAECEKCPYFTHKIVPPVGDQTAEALVVVGMEPGREEVYQGRPFVGPSGKLLRAMIANNGGDPEKLYLTNAVLCDPFQARGGPVDEYERGMAALCCRPRLIHELMQHPADKILTLGILPAETLIPDWDKDFGRGVWHSATFGTKTISIMPGMHPAAILRKPSEAGSLNSDIGKFLRGHGKPRFNLYKPPRVIVPSTAWELRKALAKCPSGETVAFDIETDQISWYAHDGHSADAILCLTIAWRDDEGLIIGDEMLYDDPEAHKALQQFFDRTDICFCGQNAAFDVIFLAERVGLHTRCDRDTMLMTYILDENAKRGLKEQAQEVFGLPNYEHELITQYLKSVNDRYSKIPFEKLAQYAVWDVVVTRALEQVQEARLKNEGLWEWPFLNVIMKAQPLLIKMERRGLQVDIEYLHRADAAMTREMERVAELARGCVNRPNLNLASTQQVAEVIYDQLHMPLPHGRKMSERSTSHEAIESLRGRHPFIDLLLQYRRIAKLKSSYIDNMIEYADANNRVHPQGMLQGTEIGRIAMRNPAAQTIPRPGNKDDVAGGEYNPYLDGSIIRGAVVAKPGCVLVICDYSQAELRVAAQLSQEPFLIEAYNNGEDLHSKVARSIFGEKFTKEQRAHCKMFNFSYLYGGNEHSFATDAGIPMSAAIQFVRDYNKAMPKLAQFRVTQYQAMVRDGYVSTVTGRRRRFVLITDLNRDEARKSAVHAPVAGTASDMALLSAVQADDEGMSVVLLVHDSVVVEAPLNLAESQALRLQAIMVQTASHFCPDVKWKADIERNKDGSFPTRWVNPPELHAYADSKKETV